MLNAFLLDLHLKNNRYFIFKIIDQSSNFNTFIKLLKYPINYRDNSSQIIEKNVLFINFL